MPDTIILVSGTTEAPYLSEALMRHRPSLTVRHAPDLAGLHLAVQSTKPARLIAFSTNLIIPNDVLEALPGPAYNFHPGPPEYPGSMAAQFAAYEGAGSFGVTVHEIAPAVDAGAIVFVRRFPVEDDVSGSDLQGRTYQVLLETFFELAPRLAADETPMPEIEEKWRLPARTRAAAETLRNDVAGVDEEERSRRRRAFGAPDA